MNDDHQEVTMSAAAATEVVTDPDTSANQPSVRKDRHRAVPLDREFRAFTRAGAGQVLRPLEIRAKADSKSVMEVEGEPIVYDTWYGVRDMFGEFKERIMPGSVTDIIDTCDCRLLLNHDGLALARNTSGTMELSDSDSGLKFKADLDMRQQLANDFVIAVERGDMNEMSVGMMVGADTWTEEREDDEILETRTITRLSDLLDVSGVTYAASPTTTISKRGLVFQALGDDESRARLLRLERDLRSGKVKPEDILAALVALRQGKAGTEDRHGAERAAGALQTVLEAVGVELDEDGQEVAPEAEEREDEGEQETPEAEAPSLHFAMALRERRRR